MADYKCIVQGVFETGTPWSFGLKVTSNQSTASFLTTWANAWGNAWSNSTYGLEAIYPTTTLITGYTVAQLDANYRWTSKATQTVSAAGTSTDDSLPIVNSMVISLRTNQVGKHARGRFYLPAPGETAINNNKLTTAVQTRVKSSVESVRAALTADGSTIFVVHEPTINPPTVAGPKYVVTEFLVPDKPATQRRRAASIRPVYL